jgi:hypothetical protein
MEIFMRRLATLITTVALTMSGLVFSPAQAKVTKPSAPTISAVSSSAVKKGKVNVKVTIALPTSNGGSKITGSRVTAGGKSCTIAKTKTSCTIKSIKNGKPLKISAKSKNKKGFSSASTSVAYTAGSGSWPTTPIATVVADAPATSSPIATVVADAPATSSPVATDTTISVAAIAGVTAPVQGATPVTTTTAGTGYTGTVSWSGSPASFALATTYTATITLTPTSGYTLTGVTANFFTVAGATSVTNSANAGVITAVFPATDTTISVAAIAGVTAPVQGATPVTTTTAGTGYTGTVTWSGTPASFALATTYTATITLTPTSGYTLTGVTANFFTVAGATSVTNSANAGVITAVFPATASTYAVGNTGPGGGIIYYVDSAGFSCGADLASTCNYLEAAPTTGASAWTDVRRSWSTGEHNQSLNVANATGTAIGTGYKNSVAIVAQSGNVAATSAAVEARAYRGPNNLSDWFLPSKDELNQLYLRKTDVGGFSGAKYFWSSSQSTISNPRAYDQFFLNGVQDYYGKSGLEYVRPVRAF